MVEMVSRDYIPAVLRYLKSIADTENAVNEAFGISIKASKAITSRIASELDLAYDGLEKLKSAISDVKGTQAQKATYYRDTVLPIMDDLRSHIDALEVLVDSDTWPVPTYGDLMFRI